MNKEQNLFKFVCIARYRAKYGRKSNGWKP